eukprot:14367333-Ditylum_brightwellii.AAC.1
MVRHDVTACTTQHASPLQDGVPVYVTKLEASVITATQLQLQQQVSNQPETGSKGGEHCQLLPGQGPSRGNHIPQPSSGTGGSRDEGEDRGGNDATEVEEEHVQPVPNPLLEEATPPTESLPPTPTAEEDNEETEGKAQGSEAEKEVEPTKGISTTVTAMEAMEEGDTEEQDRTGNSNRAASRDEEEQMAGQQGAWEPTVGVTDKGMDETVMGEGADLPGFSLTAADKNLINVYGGTIH